MTVVVQHRPDRLLERAVNEECPEDLKDTFVGMFTWPVHRAAHQFLEEKLVGKTFANVGEVQAVLKTWPQYAGDKGAHLTKEFRTLEIAGGNVISFPDRGLGGGLQIAFVEAA